MGPMIGFWYCSHSRIVPLCGCGYTATNGEGYPAVGERRTETISHSLMINASAETLYDMVADVTRMGAWRCAGGNRRAALVSDDQIDAMGRAFDTGIRETLLRFKSEVENS